LAKLAALTFDRRRLERIPARRIRWSTTYRLQSARHPPIALFERIAPPDEHQILAELASLTDPAARQAIGRISLDPPEKRAFGPGASALMGPFVHASRDNPSRFSDGAYGIYYAGRQFETALREVAFHRGRFHARTRDPATSTTFKTITASLDKILHDIRKGSWAELLQPDPAQYAFPQSVGARLREAGSNGIVYPSVRRPGGECLGAFWPNVLGPAAEGRRIALQWDGSKIASWFDFETNAWADL
jgi:hypothetical protein